MSVSQVQALAFVMVRADVPECQILWEKIIQHCGRGKDKAGLNRYAMRCITMGCLMPLKGLWSGRAAGTDGCMMGVKAFRSSYGHVGQINMLHLCDADGGTRRAGKGLSCNPNCETLQTMAPPGSRVSVMRRPEGVNREVCVSDPDAPVIDYPDIFIAAPRDLPFYEDFQCKKAIKAYFSIHLSGIIRGFQTGANGEQNTEAYWEGKYLKARNTCYHNAVRRMWGLAFGVTAFAHHPGPVAHQKCLPAKATFKGQCLSYCQATKSDKYSADTRQYMYAMDWVLNKSFRLQAIRATHPRTTRDFKKLTLSTFEKKQHGPYEALNRYTNPTIHIVNQF